MSRFEFSRRLAWLMFVLVLGTAWPASHGVASAQTMPPGYTVSYQDYWPATDQFKFVRVTIKPLAAAAPQDVVFYVVAKQSSHYTGVTVSTRIEIKKGDTSATGELYVPTSVGQTFSIHTEIDGNLKSDRYDYAKISYYYDNNVGSLNNRVAGLQLSFVLASSDVMTDPSIEFTALNRSIDRLARKDIALATTDEFPDLDDLWPWFDLTPTGGNRSIMSINGFSSPLAAALSLDALPSRWFGYKGIDAVMITLSDLKLLQQQYPEKYLAIQRWASDHGRLIVLNCGSKLQNAEQALKALGDGPRIDANRECQFFKKAPSPAVIDDAMEFVVEQFTASTNYYGGNVGGNQRLEKFMDRSLVSIGRDTLKNVLTPTCDKALIGIEFGRGQVVCLSDSASFWGNENPKEDRWGQVIAFLSHTGLARTFDHSIACSFPLRGLGFPEFDQPPRYLFEGAIILYLLGVGPLLAYVLKRSSKQNLMFIVVPFISFVFCSGILLYAIIAEGFDTRVNLFTLTELDQRTGRQTTSAIAHVYSGMTPSQYRLTEDTCGMINIPPQGRTQNLKWDNDGELINGGEMRARTSHQLISRCVNETEDKLGFSVSKNGQTDGVSVQNGLKQPVVAVAFRTDHCESDEVWLCQNLPSGESKAAQKMTAKDASDAIRNAVRDLGKTMVLSKKKGWLSTNYDTRRHYYGHRASDIDTTEVAGQLGKCWHLSSAQLSSFLPQNEQKYLAITKGGHNYQMPIPDAKTESEIHVILGIR